MPTSNQDKRNWRLTSHTIVLPSYPALITIRGLKG